MTSFVYAARGRADRGACHNGRDTSVYASTSTSLGSGLMDLCHIIQSCRASSYNHAKLTAKALARRRGWREGEATFLYSLAYTCAFSCPPPSSATHMLKYTRTCLKTECAHHACVYAHLCALWLALAGAVVLTLTAHLPLLHG